MNVASGVGYRVRIDDARSWEHIRTDWARLHAASDAPTYFLSTGWMDAWLSIYADGLQPRFARFERGDELVGIVMVCVRNKRHGFFGVRSLQLNTAGEGADSPMLEHNALLCAPAIHQQFAAALSAFLATQSWDVFELSGIRQADWRLLGPGCGTTATEQWRDAPYVDLDRLRADGIPYLECLSRNTRHQIRRSMSLYEARGGLQIERAGCTDEALSWFGELVDLHQAVWSARGKPGAFASPRQRAFHERIIATGAAEGAAQVLRVRADRETIGVLYNLVHQGHVSYYQSGMRYESDNRLKPGLVCHALAIQDALERGCREYDFLAAANDGARYKSSLANASRQFGWVTVRRDSPKLRILDVATEARRRWRNR